jgi:hypothetical protein
MEKSTYELVNGMTNGETSGLSHETRMWPGLIVARPASEQKERARGILIITPQ